MIQTNLSITLSKIFLCSEKKNITIGFYWKLQFVCNTMYVMYTHKVNEYGIVYAKNKLFVKKVLRYFVKNCQVS